MKKILTVFSFVFFLQQVLNAADRETFDAMPGFEGMVSDVQSDGNLFIRSEGYIEEIILLGLELPRDAPGSNTGYKKKAVEFMKKYAVDKEVKVKITDEKRDSEKRLKGYVWRIEDNVMINFVVIRTGFGHADNQNDYFLKREFKYAEQQAREEGLGLWGRSLREIKATAQSSHSSDLDTMIYLTTADKKYHQDYCSQLQQDRYQVKLGDAQKAGYEPCLICHPEEKSGNIY